MMNPPSSIEQYYDYITESFRDLIAERKQSSKVIHASGDNKDNDIALVPSVYTKTSDDDITESFRDLIAERKQSSKLIHASGDNKDNDIALMPSVYTKTSDNERIMVPTSLMESMDVPLLAVSRHLLQPSGQIVGKHVADVILPSFPTFCSAIPTELGGRVALASIDGRTSITHERVRDFCIDDFGPSLHSLGYGRGDRIALVLPNGPELALAIFATAQWASCVPLSANGAISELEADLLQCGANLVIGPMTMTSPQANAEKCAAEVGIPFVGLVPSPTESGIFSLVHFDQKVQQKLLLEPNGANDEVLVLFTSGTTGNKKLVPHVMGDMLTAAATIALSWNLRPTDVNCNLMPLFHVGGIVRQVFSPIFSGGSVICCPSFDPVIFWALLAKNAFTWYYAAPTMHQLILQTGKSDGFIDEDGRCQYKLRMIANAAGGLLPSLAKEMMLVFNATILPSYGMTECMPIASPPSTYRLEKTGTSGVAVGPELAILNTTTLKPLLRGEEGSICVRGEPCFRGYGKIANNDSDTTLETFLDGGWFNTGDLGYLDEDGYLFITGRSKEVINRGGEIISPMEVEEATMSHPDIVACAAFSALHNVLQEVVGIVVVMKAGRPRMDLATLHGYLSERLAAPKWPQCLVFMESLPKSHTNKLLRVKLGTRLQLPELSDDMNTAERTFEAVCPPQGTAIDVLIQANRVALDASDIGSQLSSLLVKSSDQRLVVVPHPRRTCAFVCYLVNIDQIQAIKTAIQSMARYSVPSHFVETNEAALTFNSLPPPSMADAVATILQGHDSSGPVDLIVKGVKKLFTELLNLDYHPDSDANFFLLGGSSMLASQLASKIRKHFAVAFSGSEVFQHSCPNKMAKLIKIRKRSNFSPRLTKKTENTSGSEDADDFTTRSRSFADHGAPFPADRLVPQKWLGATLVQLLPLFIVFPIYQVSRYNLFFFLLVWCKSYVPLLSFWPRFVVVSFICYTVWITIIPLIFVALKWMIIGRYKAGRYPIFGCYYLRWWFVDVMRKLFGRGIWGSNEALLAVYYRMLGAKIGTGARIHTEADIAEFDLVDIGENAAIETSTMRGFGVDNGAMILGPVKVGNNSSVGIKSIVAPYTSIPDYSHLGPVSSSYDTKAVGIVNAGVNRKSLPGPPMWMRLLIIWPITFLVYAVSQIPPFFVLYMMLLFKGKDLNFETLSDIIDWLADPRRIPFYIAIVLARTILSPFFYMATALFVKKLLIGRFTSGPRNTSDWQLLRHSLSASLFSRERIQHVTDIIGRHYEMVSVLYRLLGAKVGKRVFWPGQQPAFSGEFDLLEIGDDVVFGSRSTILFTTKDLCAKVILCAGSNVADNSVILPGGIIGKNAVLASNSLCPEGKYLPEGSVWLGSKGCEPTCLKQGNDSREDNGIDITPSFRDLTKSFRDLIAERKQRSKVIHAAGDNNDNDITLVPAVYTKTSDDDIAKSFRDLIAKGRQSSKLIHASGDNKDNDIALVPAIYTKTCDGNITMASSGGYINDGMRIDVRHETLSMTGDTSTLSPFGKAFYLRKASYFVWTLGMLISFTVIVRAIIVTFHILPVWLAYQYGWLFLTGNNDSTADIDISGGILHATTLLVYLCTHLLRTILWVAIELIVKWIIIGRRKEGQYNYDTSSYGQRWEIYQIIISNGRKFGFADMNLMDFINGTSFMSTFLRWNGATIGKDCCLYPAGANPSMTEPDLVFIGDRCVIDNASIVCHLNTRGNFELAKIIIENDCTLRNGSRIQQACHMEEGSQLLEKSLAMTGEIIEANSIWQGCPASSWFQYERQSNSKVAGVEVV